MFRQLNSSFPCFALIGLISISCVQTGSAQYSRSNALRQAQVRGETVNQRPNPMRPTRFAQGSGSRAFEGSPVINSPTPTGSPVMSNGPIVGGPAGGVGGYTPQHMNLAPGEIMMEPGVEMGDSYFESGVPYDNYEGSFGGCGVGGDICANRNGGCGPECWNNCWINCIGGIFSSGEVFAGAHGFRSRNFTAGTQVVDDSSFGFYGGANFGMGLCPLTCGLFSTQIGVRSSQSEFDGDFFSSDNRDQLFVTAGIFRRVDYGLQMGIVGDFLHEEWFVETDLAQVRGDIGWVYPGGNTLGFRFAYGTEDDVTNGIINGVAFDNLLAQVVDNYRFYYRIVAENGGNCDLFAGWSDADHAVLGIDYDMPIR
ncbi:MAG: DUF6666 family protein, partial [Planctomycetota bacterium]